LVYRLYKNDVSIAQVIWHHMTAEDNYARWTGKKWWSISRFCLDTYLERQSKIRKYCQDSRWLKLGTLWIWTAW